ncbi:MAG: protein kinase [Oscillospiraceae bacterium]|nr:protein kinase [Oscillospiraceae bacterium]
MDELNLSTKLLDGMEVVESVSETGGTYLLRRQADGQTFILKYISLPESSTQIEALRLAGSVQTDDDAKAYFAVRAEEYRSEVAALEKLSKVTNIAAFDACDFHEKEDGVGYDVYLLAEQRQTLAEYFARTPMTHLKAANLALDLCGALADLRKAGLMHVNIKPENILLNQKGHFMLSDLGLFRTEQLKFASFPRRMLSAYSAPELYGDLSPMNTTQDIYAVGVILYNIYNGGHAPFEDEYTSAVAATERRIAGESMPVPLYADYEMSEIILKTCAFDPADRYQSPEELKEALTDYVKRNELADAIIVPPIVTDEDTQLTQEAMEEKVEPVQFAKKEELDEEFVEHFSPDTESLNELVANVQAELEEEAKAAEPVEEAAEEAFPADDAEFKPKKRVPIWIWIALCAVLLAATAVFVYFSLTPNVVSAEIGDITSGAFTVTPVTEGSNIAVTAYCVDAYGNRFDGTADGGTFEFEGLSAGTQYTVRFETAEGRATRGISSVSVTTAESTDILYFVAKPISETQLELTFNLSGPDHDSWRVVYAADGGAEKDILFSDHHVTIADLTANTSYVFTLSCPDGTELTGETELRYDTTVSVTDVELTARYDYDTAALTVSWTFKGDAPAEWVVNCYGADGTSDTRAVKGAENEVTFEKLTDGEMYTVELYCRGMAATAQTLVRTSGLEISDLAAEWTGGSSATVTWTCADEGEWIVTYTPKIKGATPQSMTVDTTSAELTALIPTASYEIEVQSAAGVAVLGQSKLTLEGESAPKFTDYGLTNIYVGYFLGKSEGVTAAKDLTTRRDSGSYAAGEKIAFAIQAISARRSSDDVVSYAYILRNADGEIVCCDTGEAVWNDMWEGSLCVGTLSETPQEAGSYTLSIYFNGGLVTSKNIEIK